MPSALEMIARGHKRELRQHMRMQASLPCSRKLSNVSFEKRGPIERFVLYDAWQGTITFHAGLIANQVHYGSYG